MATAYKYVERKAEDNINWAEVGSNVNNMLNEEMRVRTEKKSAIDEATREYQKVLNTVPQGENSELNKFALGFSDDLQKQMLMQETLLKSGQLSPSQYTMMRQNLTDGTDQGFSLLQDYNNEYEAKMSLLGDDVAYGDQLSQIDLEIMANVEGFSNFSNAKLVINPESGLVSMGIMIVNPDDPEGPRILDPNRNNLVSVQNLRNRIKTKITKYDVVGNAEKYSATLGTDVRETVESMGTAYRAGILKEITDIRNKDGGYKDMSEAQIAELAKKMNVLPSDISAVSLWQKSSRDWAQSQLQGGSYNAASTLMDFSKFTPDGLQYTTTFDESETLDENGNRKENVILLKSENGRTVTKMTEAQNIVAEEALVAQLNIQLDYKENVTPEKMKSAPTPEPKDVRDAAAELEKKQSLQKTWNSIKGQSAEERVASFEALIGSQIGKDAGLIGVNPSEDGTSISFVYKDENASANRTIKIDENISDQEWANIGNEITGIDSPVDALNSGGFIKDEDGNSKKLNKDFGDAGGNREGNLQRFDAELSTFINDGFPEVEIRGSKQPFLKQEQKAVVIALNDRYSQYGLNAVATGKVGADNTRVTIDGWKGNEIYPSFFNLDSDFSFKDKALDAEDKFKKWLAYVLNKTNQLERIAQAENFTGKVKKSISLEDEAAKYGPCVDGKKIELETNMPIDCIT